MYKIKKIKITLRPGKIFLHVYQKGTPRDQALVLKNRISERIAEIAPALEPILVYQTEDKETFYFISPGDKLIPVLRESTDPLDKAVLLELMERARDLLIRILERNKKNQGYEYTFCDTDESRLPPEFQKKIKKTDKSFSVLGSLL